MHWNPFHSHNWTGLFPCLSDVSCEPFLLWDMEFLLGWHSSLWENSFGNPPAEAFWTSLVCWHCSDPLPVSGFLMQPRTVSPFLSFSFLSLLWGVLGRQGGHKLVGRERRSMHRVGGAKKMIKSWGSVPEILVKSKRATLQFPFTWHFVEPQTDLLSPSCSDAPEGPAHRSYCSSSWPSPQLNNAASVLWLNRSDRETPVHGLAWLTGAPCVLLLLYLPPPES